MTREACTQRVLEAKQAKGVTFQEVADRVARHVVWTTSALLGQSTMSADEAAKAGERLGWTRRRWRRCSSFRRRVRSIR